MKTKVYCLASAKGGSGKTILCASFAAFLADLGKKVLIIDLDAATHGLTLLYLNEVNSYREEIATNNAGDRPHGIFDWGDASPRVKDFIPLPNGVSLLPATLSFSAKKRTPNAEAHLTMSLNMVLGWAKGQFDYVLLDAQAGTDEYAQIAMSKEISHEVVIVSEYDPLSAAGIERLKAVLRDDLLYSRTWVLLNKLLPDFTATFSEFLEVSKYLTPIPWDPDVVRAYARRQLPLDLNYGNPFTLAVMQTLKKLLGDTVASEIDEWAKNRASNIREPIENQYQDAEKELSGLLEEKFFLENQSFRRRLMRIFMVSIIPITLIIIAATLTKYDFLHKSYPLPYAIIMIIGGVTVLTGFFLSMTKTWAISTGQKVEEARFARQLNIVEDRLNKLEVLRKADLETLVKEGTKRP